MSADNRVERRLQSLEAHLKQENPILDGVIDRFRHLDRIARRLGYFDKDQSHTYHMPWWPLISVLGTYSSGKSAFINYMLTYPLQPTGNQAVDDKFTVICFGRDSENRVLPGLALDADPRFPLFKVSSAIEEVAPGEGGSIDTYLQLKTCSSETLLGQILIDSPGFDADAQRTSTLRIADHIIDLSDLVLVFFDARHPEVGSMTNTLEHLVRNTISRHDANKILFILNQIDSTAYEDNTEEVFAAWQRALAQYGLTAGSCFAIYNPDLAVAIADEKVRTRLEQRRKDDYQAITRRIDQVGIERAYRIVGMMRKGADDIENRIVPIITQFVTKWRRLTLFFDGVIFGLIGFIAFILIIWPGYLQDTLLHTALVRLYEKVPYVVYTLAGICLAGAGYIHFTLRRKAASWVARKCLAPISDPSEQANFRQAFNKNSRWYRSIIFKRPAGWSKKALASLAQIREDADVFILKLNDMYTDPSGSSSANTCQPASAISSSEQ